MEASWIASQKKAFARWANNVLKQRGLVINDIDHDLRTGSLLISLVEILEGNASPRKLTTGNSVSSGLHAESKIQSFTGATKALKFIEAQGINLVNVRPDHLVDNNSKMVLGLLWRVIAHYHIQPLIAEDEMVPDYDGKATPAEANKSLRMKAFLNKSLRDALLRWCKNELETYNILPTNFTKSFQSPSALAALVHKQKPEIINLDEINKMEPTTAFSKIFELAESQLGIPQILDPSDIMDAGGSDECSMMTYIAYFLQRTSPTARTFKRARSQTDLVLNKYPSTANLAEVREDNSEELATENSKLREENRLLKEFIKSELEKVSSTMESSMQRTAKLVETKTSNLLTKAQSFKGSLDRLTSITSTTTKDNRRLRQELSAAQLKQTEPVSQSPDVAEELKRLRSEVAKMDALRAEVAKMDALQAEVAKMDALQAEVAKMDALRAEAAKVDTLRAEVAKMDALRAEVAKMDDLRAEVAKMDALRLEVAKLDVLRSEAAREVVRTEATRDMLRSEVARVDILQNELQKLKQDNDKLHKENQSLQSQLSGSASPTSHDHDLSFTDTHQTATDSGDESEHTLTTRSPQLERAVSPRIDKAASPRLEESASPKIEAKSPRISSADLRPIPPYSPSKTNTPVTPTSPQKETPGKLDLGESKRRALRARLKGEELRIYNITIVQSLVRRWLVKKWVKRVNRRRIVVSELMTTERTYVACLQTLLAEYFQPLRKMAAEGQPLSHTLNENLLKTIFNNAEVICNINSNLLSKLELRWKSWSYDAKLGDVFLSTIEFLKCYNQYVNHYNRSLDTLAECGKITAFMDFLKVKALKCGHHLRDLLIVPVQRIPRYVILLEELMRYTDKAHPDHKELTLALSKMHKIADYVNEKKRDFEALAQVSAIQETLIGISILEYPRLRFLLEGDLVSDVGKKTNQYHVFLFNEIVLCTKLVKKVFGDRKQKQVKYKCLEMIKLTPETKVGKFELSFSIDIPNTPTKKFTTTTEKDRDLWIQNIQNSVDKMIEAKKTKSVDRL